MKITRLNNSHLVGVKHLFTENQYLVFCDTYLSDLSNFHAYGLVQSKKNVLSLISFYESVEEPSWYLTFCKSNNYGFLLKNILDKIIEHNEKNGRFKFYSLINQNYVRSIRKFCWSKYNNNRYGYFDEYFIPKMNKCYYSNHWELLYQRSLINLPTIVRCNFLKQEFRNKLPIGGNL